MSENPPDPVGDTPKLIDLVHDLANHLNLIVLQASCLLLKVDDTLKEEVEVIRREGIQAACLVRPMQQIAREIGGS